GRTCLELGEIDDLHALQEGEVADTGGHGTSFLTIWRRERARHSPATPGLSNVTRPRASSGSLTWVVRAAYPHPKSHFTGRRSLMSAHHTPEEIRKGLTHPVIDGDGHWVEYTPVFAERIRKVTGDLGANGFLQSQRRGPDSLSMTPEQRAERGVAMEGFWGRQSTNTRDRATAMMPRMLYDRLDELGIDSEHDYDPLWQKCRELGIAPTFHTGGRSYVERNSPTNFTFNHIGHFAAAGHYVAKALFLGGVTRRFLDLRFAFLEGGVGWGCQLFCDLIEHWERRGAKGMANMDPTKLNRPLLRELVDKYGYAD